MLIVQTPLRISLFGGGTDFPSYYEEHGGCVLTTAINKYTYVILKSRQDKRVRVSCTHIQTVSHIHNLRHDLIREAMKLVGVDRGIEIYTIGDVPAGTGLGSSSSITVGLLKALHTYKEEEVSSLQIAEEACKIEREILGRPIGVQDHYITALGGFRFLWFSSTGIELGAKIVGSGLDDWMMLFFTGIVRKAEDVLAEQERRVVRNTALLDKIQGLTYMARGRLLEGDYSVMGELLDRYWRIKKGLSSGVTNEKLDGFYKTAMKAGALGGKITGAGGGGFLLTLSQPDKKDAIRKALKLRELPFAFDPCGTRVVYDQR